MFLVVWLHIKTCFPGLPATGKTRYRWSKYLFSRCRFSSRPIHELRIWNYEGLTQCRFLTLGGGIPGSTVDFPEISIETILSLRILSLRIDRRLSERRIGHWGAAPAAALRGRGPRQRSALRRHRNAQSARLPPCLFVFVVTSCPGDGSGSCTQRCAHANQ